MEEFGRKNFFGENSPSPSPRPGEGEGWGRLWALTSDLWVTKIKKNSFWFLLSWGLT